MTYQEWEAWKRSQNEPAFEAAKKKAKNASSDRRQFEKYRAILKSWGRETGWPKGRNITKRLGYSADNWEKLCDEIMRGSKRYIATRKGNNGHGEKYEQLMVLYGQKDDPTNVVVS